METILIKVEDFKRVLNILGGNLKLVDQTMIAIETDRFDRRSLIRAGISYRYKQ